MEKAVRIDEITRTSKGFSSLSRNRSIRAWDLWSGTKMFLAFWRAQNCHLYWRALQSSRVHDGSPIYYPNAHPHCTDSACTALVLVASCWITLHNHHKLSVGAFVLGMLTVRVRSRDGLERLQIESQANVSQLKDAISKLVKLPTSHFIISTRQELVRFAKQFCGHTCGET